MNKLCIFNNGSAKTVSIQEKSTALARPLQVLQVRPYRVVCKRFSKLFSCWTDSSSSWSLSESHPLQVRPRHHHQCHHQHHRHNHCHRDFCYLQLSQKSVKQKKARHVARTTEVLKKIAPDWSEGKICEKVRICVETS